MLWCALAAALSAGGCVPDVQPKIALDETTVVPAPVGLVFWVDGVGSETFNALQRAGKLPNITRYLIDRGVTVRNAVASLPTITYANNVSFLTGLFPGHHGIVGNKWFDRHRLILRHYGHVKTYRKVDQNLGPIRTIFEALDDEFTASILTPVRRGATRNIDNWATAGVAWYFRQHAIINRLTTRRLELIARAANAGGRWPKFIYAYFVTPDTVGHADGTTSGRYVEMILDVDRQIGHMCKALQAAGLLDRTVIALISDHGFVDTPKHWDLAEYFRENLKVPTIRKSYGRDEPFEQRAAHFANARAVVVTGGNRRTNIYLRAADHWWPRPTEKQIDDFVSRPRANAPYGVLPEMLARLPATDLVVVRLGAGSVRVQNETGAGVIDRVVRGGAKAYRYRVIRGTDPLGYASDPKAAALMDGGHHAADAWLAATAGTGRPDVAVQLIELNDSSRSGDVVVFAADGWDLGGDEKGGHGGLLRREIVVPWVWAGPGLPGGASISTARTVDLMPTMLHLIGRADAIGGGLDGVSIADRLRAAAGKD